MPRSSLFPGAPDPAPAFDASAFVHALSSWFQREQRDLPWRRSENARDPYRVLVSEVMLQQTTVAAVVPFYDRFIERFPTLQVLAGAEIDDVLPLWAGLGYYSRARNLHACAREVVEKHGGAFPRELAQVLALPGVGRYTAGAVTSIAFGAPSAIVDANVARVLSRVRLVEGDIKAPATLSRVWAESERLISTAHAEGIAPWSFNPAMMELGALVCRPREPICEACPVAQWCAARSVNRQRELPHTAPKAQPTKLFDACVFATREVGGPVQVLVRQRPHAPGAWWRGMWELPRLTIARGEPRTEEEARSRLQQWLRDKLEIEAQVGLRAASLKHGITTFDVSLDCFHAQAQVLAERADVSWATWDEIEQLATPSPMRRLLRRLRDEQKTAQRSLF
jgi:A/G-specific adenine glycosylase